MNKYGCLISFLLLALSCGKAEPEVMVAEPTSNQTTGDGLAAADRVLEHKEGLERVVVNTPTPTTQSPSFRLLLLGISRGGPQANVAVRSCTDSFWQSDEIQVALLEDGTPPQQIQELPSTVSGGDGLVSIPLPGKEVMVVIAERDGLWVWERIEKAKEDQIITMQIPDQDTFSVRVLDQDGLPAIGVSILPFLGPRPSMHIDTGAENRLSRFPDGLVHLSDIKRFREFSESFSKQMAAEAGNEEPFSIPLRAYADILTIEDMFVDLPLPASSEVVDFHLSPTGSLRVNIQGIDNAAGTVSISAHAEVPDFYGSSISDIPFSQGVIDIPYIGLGLDLNIRAQLNGESGTHSIQVKGPQSAGEVVAITLAIEPSMFISGRLVDSRGRPISGDRVKRAIQGSSWDNQLAAPSMTLFAGQFYPRSQELTLNEDGQFRAMIDFHEFGEKVYALHIDFAGKTFSSQVAIPIGTGETKLGEVQLGTGPALLAGQVINAKGEGLGGVELTLEFQRDWRGSLRWMEYPGAKILSRKDGSFRVPYSYNRGQGRLTAKHGAYSQLQPLVVRSGDMDIQLPMSMGGELVCTYFAPEGFSDYNLSLKLSKSLDDVELSAESSYHNKDLRKFHFLGVPDGEYRVAFDYAYFEEGFLPQSGIMVRAGEVCADSRLQNMDLGLGLREVKFNIRNSSGEPLSEFSLYIVQNGKAQFMPGVESDSSFWAPLEAHFDVAVFSDEFGAGMVKDVGASFDLSLTKTRWAHLQVADDVELDTPAGRLHLLIRKQTPLSGFDYKIMPWNPAPVDAQRTFSGAVPGPGRFTLYWLKGDERKSNFTTSLVLTEEDLQGVVTVHPPGNFQ